MEWLMGQATKRYGDKRGFVSRSVVIRLHGGPHDGTRAEVETLNDTKVIVNHATREVAAYRRVADVDYGYSAKWSDQMAAEWEATLRTFAADAQMLLVRNGGDA
jgi:hypothetical protein